MSGSIFGNTFQCTTFGESHGKALGVVIDGCPAGIPLTVPYLMQYMDRRTPGRNAYSTSRKESDTISILSGVFNDVTTGTPIALVIYNEDSHSADYSELASYYRPGHADFTYDQKYGFRDYRGGGRSSGRETCARVAAGAVAAALLSSLGISVCAYTRSISTYSCLASDDYLYQDFASLSELALLRDASPLMLPNVLVSDQAEAFLRSLKEHGDSAGGTIECVIKGLPAGLGEPVFDKFDAMLAHAMLSIGAVKGIEIGSGFSAASMLGSNHNDAFYVDENAHVKKRSNHAGGVLGGITDGSDVCFRVVVKPTPSITSPKETVTVDGSTHIASVTGRHDPVIVPRAVVVVEAMAALVAADALLQNTSSNLSKLKSIYETIE